MAGDNGSGGLAGASPIAEPLTPLSLGLCSTEKSNRLLSKLLGEGLGGQCKIYCRKTVGKGHLPQAPGLQQMVWFKFQKLTGT